MVDSGSWFYGGKKTMKPQICFLALNVYPTLAGTPETRVGGAEVQQCQIARYLARCGYTVSFVTRDYGQPDAENIDGITVYKAFKMSAGLPFLRFFHPRWTGIWRALAQAGADVYYQRCASMETGLLAMFCRWYGKKFVFASGSEADFDLKRAIIPTWRDRWLYSYGLSQAHAIVAQTETQRDLLKENFQLDAQVISNCWDEEKNEVKQSHPLEHILWVSTLRKWKRPQLFLDLAECLPHFRFVMVGGPAMGEEGLYDQIVERAQSIKNLSFVGFVPFHEVGRYFDHASVVVNTSESKEGFPNTFLQAWCRSIPVVSFFDPDNIIQRHQLGFASESIGDMLIALRRLIDDAGLYKKLQHNVVTYFNNNHILASIGVKYEILFNEMINE